MKLFIMRHGQAEFSAPSDKLRNLTPLGIEESTIMAKWMLTQQKDFSITFVSPYNRAQQTYEYVTKQIGMSEHHYCLEDLSPESSPKLCGDALLAYCAHHNVNSALVVSHLPLVDLLVTDLCRGDMVPSFSTSSIACVDIDLETWQGSLLWHRTFKDVLAGIS